MSQGVEIIDNTGDKRKDVPKLVRVLAILSFIGNGLFILAVLIYTFIVFFSMDKLIDDFNIDDSGTVVGVFVLVVAFILGLCALSLFGALRMYKGRKNGFVLYAIGEGIWGVLIFIGNGGVTSNIILGIVSIGFIIAFATQLKKLN